MILRSSKAILAIVALLIISACQKKEETAAETPRPVFSMVVTRVPADVLRLPGVVEPKIEADLGFRVLGRMIARKVNVGDVVKKGDVIAAIDPLSLELAVRSAQSDVDNAQAQLDNATTSEQRQSALAAAQSGTEASKEQAEQGKRTAAAGLSKARASLDKAREQFGYAELRAEFDGVVTATLAEVGQVVSIGQTIATVARPDERDAVVDVPQSASTRLRVGALFEVSLQSNNDIRTTGIVREVAPQAEAATRTLRTKISLQNAPEAFRLGSVVTAATAPDVDPAIFVPSSAILVEGDQTSVWIVDVPAKKVRKRDVQVENGANGDSVRIASGVAEGDRVVTAGVHKLTEGQQIKIDQEISK